MFTPAGLLPRTWAFACPCFGGLRERERDLHYEKESITYESVIHDYELFLRIKKELILTVIGVGHA